MGFFQDFNFDTLLALISCVTGIIALIIGSVAYKNCKINKNSINAKKHLNNSSVDGSINIGGDYYVQGVSENALVAVVGEMHKMTSASCSSALNKVYDMFQRKCDENLHQIINETQRIVSEQKLCIAGYSKLDWIHIYFEAAKNTSDSFMQKTWAKVLAKELSEPNSFSYKTLDALKNMSEIEFRLFEKLCAINVSNAIFKGDYLNDYGLDWIALQRLKEFGLLSLDDSQREIFVEANNQTGQHINTQFLLMFTNYKEQKLENHIPCYMLTTVANELLKVVSVITEDSWAIKVAQMAKAKASKDCEIKLHRINFIYNNGKSCNYQEKNLLTEIQDGSGSKN